jgi:DNA invertase Pin-like site-specific DNA recombinase
MATTRKTAKKATLTAWAYVRYSTDKQGQNSIDRQRESIARWAERAKVTLVGESSDLELSRTLDHGERPGLVAALETIRTRHVDMLVAESVSRLAGDSYILGAIRRELPKGARLVTCDDVGVPDLDEDMQEFRAMHSRQEIKQIRARTKGALAAKRLRGEISGTLRYGWRRKANGLHVGGRDRRCAADCTGCLHPEQDPAEQAVIARVKALSDTGLAIRAIAARLAVEGVVGRPHKRGGTPAPLSHTQVHRMLRPLLIAEEEAREAADGTVAA